MEPHVAHVTLTPHDDSGANRADAEGPARSACAFAVELRVGDGPPLTGTARFDFSAVVVGDVTARELLQRLYTHTAAVHDCLLLGQLLWAQLFAESSPQIRAAWTQFETARRMAAQPLHLHVHAPGPDGLAELPIELLADGDGFVFWRPGNELFVTGPDGGLRARARRLVAVGRVLANEERYDDALDAYRTAIELCDRGHDRLGEALARLALGDLFVAWDRPGEAGDAYLSALPVFETLGEAAGEAAARRSLGDLYLREGRLGEAEAAFVAAAACYEQLGDRAGHADAVIGQGNLALLRGDPAEAFARFRAAMALHEGARDRLGRATAHGYMARAAHEVGANDRAAMLAAHAWAMFREGADEFGQRVALDDLTQILRDRKDRRGAVAAMFMAWVAARNLSEPSVDERAERLARAIDNFDPRRPSPSMYRKLEEVLFTSLAACQQALEERGEDPRGPLADAASADAASAGAGPAGAGGDAPTRTGARGKSGAHRALARKAGDGPDAGGESGESGA